MPKGSWSVSYTHLIKDVKEAIEQGLPEQSRTVIHPNLGAAYAFLARVYLQMANYEAAFTYRRITNSNFRYCSGRHPRS